MGVGIATPLFFTLAGEPDRMEPLSEAEIFEAAVKLMLRVDRRITIQFIANSIAIQFPTTRKLADYLKVPHYYILPFFAMMERDGLITRVERVGISTTLSGTRKLIEHMATGYKEELEELLGRELFHDLWQRIELASSEPKPLTE
jgi:DNA-binding transcriptional regulator YhcF (GntR family)